MDSNRYEQNFGTYHLNDKRLNRRAFSIGAALSQYFGQALSTIFKNAKELKRTYEFSPILK